MRDFEYKEQSARLLVPEIVRCVSLIHEFRGAQEFLIRSGGDALEQMADSAVVHSMESSGRIEGICLKSDRVQQIADRSIAPIMSSERETAGYRNVLTKIRENPGDLDLTPELFKQFHRDIFAYDEDTEGMRFRPTDPKAGEFRDCDDAVTDSDGASRVPFRPVTFAHVEDAVSRMIESFADAWNSGSTDKLLLIPLFIMDYLYVQPFNDGNGRISRLLTLLLLSKAGYFIGNYISIESVIEKTKRDYYEALYASCIGWHDNANDPIPFAQYYLNVLVGACGEFGDNLSD